MNNDPQGSAIGASIDNTHPTKLYPQVVPAKPGTEIASNLVQRRLTRALEHRHQLAESCSNLLAQIETATKPVPDNVITAAARMHNLLATLMPGQDLTPKSVEVVNDPVLHAKALIEAKAAQRTIDKQVEEMKASLPAELKELASELDLLTTQGAHREEIADAYERGIADGKHADSKHKTFGPVWDAGYQTRMDEETRELRVLSLWALVKAWWGIRTGKRKTIARAWMVSKPEPVVPVFDEEAADAYEATNPPPYEPTPYWKNNASVLGMAENDKAPIFEREPSRD